MASEVHLAELGFRRSLVTAKQLDIVHPDPTGLGPFCRLAVDDTAPATPGVYALVSNANVMYVGRADQLRQIVHGTRMGRAYNDYTYVPASKVRQTSSPRVRINGLLNREINAGATVEWWWLTTGSSAEAVRTEAELISTWKPPWNRARPIG